MITIEQLEEKLTKLKAGEQQQMQNLAAQRGAIEFCEHLIVLAKLDSQPS